MDIILHFAEYYATLSTVMTQTREIRDGRELCVQSRALTQEMLSTLLRVHVVVRGHDQGWSSYPQDQGSKRNSWTWYTMNTCNAGAPPECGADDARLATNLHASSETQTHEFNWTPTDEMVQGLQAGQCLCVWAHARYARLNVCHR